MNLYELISYVVLCISGATGLAIHKLGNAGILKRHICCYIFKIKAVHYTCWNECSENTMCPYHCVNFCYNDFILLVRAYCKLSAKLLRVVVPQVIQGRLTRQISYIVSNNRKSIHVDKEGHGMR
jgi:hypothetical protein